MSDEAVHPLVTVSWLAAHLADAGVRLVDLRWSIGGPPPGEQYAQSHLPGAVRVDLDADLAKRPGAGRHPLPPVAEFAALLARLGVAEDTHVVVYDDGPGAYAARLWFMLRLHGHARASVLDGGLAAWRETGLPLTAEVPHIAEAPLRRLARDESLLVDRAQVAALLAGRDRPGPRTLLLDARAPERYRGELEPLDRVPGHIPGAVNAPFANNLRAGRFKEAQELRALYESLGAHEAAHLIASCGSGVTACHTLLALAAAGIPGARLYVGSYSDWSSHKGARIATGSEPG
jgi:thiosulfate/3-mercaptopyruvate sulfurtransferase